MGEAVRYRQPTFAENHIYMLLSCIKLRLTPHYVPAAIISQVDLGDGVSAAFPGQQVNSKPELIDVNLVQPATAATDEASEAAGGTSAGLPATAMVRTYSGGAAGSFPG